MKLFLAAFFCLFVGRSQSQDYSSLESDFEDGIEPWSQNSRNSAQWVWAKQGDGGAAPTPIEGNGYLTTQVVSGTTGRAILQSPKLSIPQGGTLSIDFWIRSKQIQRNTLDVSLLVGNDQRPIVSLTEYATPFNSIWRRATAILPASDQPVQIVIDGFYTTVNGDGIAIDNIRVLVKEEPSTTGIWTETTGLPESTTELWTETTEVLPESTTELWTETTEVLPESTTELLSTPTEVWTQTTEGQSESSTELLTTPTETTEAQPESTTELLTTPTEVWTEGTTTPPTPTGPLLYDFETGLQGWTLGRQNGARWKRTEVPGNGGGFIEVNWIDLYAGGVVAESPFLVADGNELPVIEISFWVKGSLSRPAQLHLKRKVNSVYDEEPFLNLDSYGTNTNPEWITVSRAVPAPDSKPFQISLYGFLGLDLNNQISVNKIVISGVRPVNVDQRLDFNFENDLEGWLTSNLDGGIWVQRKYNAISGGVSVPLPPFGEGVLFATSYVTHSGVITIESPPIEVPAGTKLKASIAVWIGDVPAQPGWLLVRVKDSNGQYDVTPFIDSTPISSSSNKWIILEKEIPIGDDTTFQLVIEAYLGGRSDSLIGVDRIQISKV